MPVNADFVGRVYPPTAPYAVGPAKIREFAEAIAVGGEVDPIHLDRQAARAAGYADVVAPPTFAFMIAQQCESQLVDDPDFALDYSRVVHAEQKFVHHRPLVAGDDVVVVLHVDAIRQAGGSSAITSRMELSVHDEPVSTSISTIVVRGED